MLLLLSGDTELNFLDEFGEYWLRGAWDGEQEEKRYSEKLKTSVCSVLLGSNLFGTTSPLVRCQDIK